MESIILLIISFVILFKANSIAEKLSKVNTPIYQLMFGANFDRYKNLITQLNKWGIRFGAVILFLMSLAMFFGPLTF